MSAEAKQSQKRNPAVESWPVRGELITSGPAARLMGRSRNTVKALVRRGRLCAYRSPTGIWRFDTADIADYLRAELAGGVV